MLPLSPDELLTTTRSVRRRLDLGRPVERRTVETCIEVALQAPSGDNAQPWTWVVIDDPATRAAAAEIYRSAFDEYVAAVMASFNGGPSPDLIRLGLQIDVTSSTLQRALASAFHLREHLADVPVLVLPTVRGRLDSASIFEQATLWGSILPAVWSFMLALRARGLGSAWTTAHLHREQDMAQLLGIPTDEVTQVGLFPVAHTIGTEFKPAGRRPATSCISWNGWAVRG